MAKSSTPLARRLIAALIPPFLRTLAWTWRMEVRRSPPEFETGGRLLLGHWHAEVISLTAAYRDRGASVMVSRSSDGEMLARVMHGLGYRTVRGSSSRGGGRALKALIEQFQAEHFIAALAADGPRGPIHRLKPGLLQLSQRSGVPIVLAVMAARRRFVFRGSWDRCYIAFPFTRCRVYFSEPIHVDPALKGEDFEQERLRVESLLRGLKHEVETSFGRDYELDPPPRKKRGPAGPEGLRNEADAKALRNEADAKAPVD